MNFILYVIAFVVGYAAGHYLGWTGGYNKSSEDYMKNVDEYFDSDR